jgi:hypothetical protein
MRPLELGTDQRISGGAGRKLPDHPGLEGTEQGCCSGVLRRGGGMAEAEEHTWSRIEARQAPEMRLT